MKKLFLAVAVVFVLSASAFGQGLPSLITNWKTSVGVALDTNKSDSFYFQIENPLLDSVISFIEINAATDNPSISCTLKSTIHDIKAGGGFSLKANARNATWTNVVEVFANFSTENTVTYTGLAESDLMAAPGLWYMFEYTSGGTGTHDETSEILNAGVLKYRQPD